MRLMRSLGIALILAVSPASASLGGKCDGAEPALERAMSWADLHGWHARFRACDDGDVAEDLDRKIVRKLAREWSSLSDLKSTLQGDDPFASFVLKHIGGDSDAKELRRVLRAATVACPKNLHDLCRDIRTAALVGIRDQRRATAQTGR